MQNKHLDHRTLSILVGVDGLTSGIEQHFHIVITGQEKGLGVDHLEEVAVVDGKHQNHRQIIVKL